MKKLEEILNSIKKDLDRLDTELAMNAEALESLDISIRLLSTEIDYDIENNS